MAHRECIKCEEEKDSKEFYKSSPHVCRDCRNTRSKETRKETKATQTSLLLEIRDDQQAMAEQIHGLNKELASIRKALKKLSK